MDEYTLSRRVEGGGAFLGRLAPTVFGLKNAGKKRNKKLPKNAVFQEKSIEASLHTGTIATQGRLRTRR